MREVGHLPDAGLLDALSQPRTGVDHRDGVFEQDLRLVAGRRGGVNLGAGLTVCRHEIQADAAAHGRLAVALSDLHVARPEPPVAVRPEPPEDGAETEDLP